MSKTANVYELVVGVTSDYLGHAAPRFIDRQIQHHLNKEPQNLSTNDLDALIDWSKVAMAVLTDDVDILDEYSARLNQIKNEQSG